MYIGREHLKILKNSFENFILLMFIYQNTFWPLYSRNKLLYKLKDSIDNLFLNITSRWWKKTFLLKQIYHLHMIVILHSNSHEWFEGRTEDYCYLKWLDNGLFDISQNFKISMDCRIYLYEKCTLRSTNGHFSCFINPNSVFLFWGEVVVK